MLGLGEFNGIYLQCSQRTWTVAGWPGLKQPKLSRIVHSCPLIFSPVSPVSDPRVYSAQ